MTNQLTQTLNWTKQSWNSYN